MSIENIALDGVPVGPALSASQHNRSIRLFGPKSTAQCGREPRLSTKPHRELSLLDPRMGRSNGLYCSECEMLLLDTVEQTSDE